MTKRAPPLASKAAVAAPRPDAEPVTIAHKLSFDIRISSCDWSWSFETHHIVPQNTCKSPKTPLRGINAGGSRCLHVAIAGAPADIGACHGNGFSPSCGARKDAADGCAIGKTRNAVAESENIVAETAEKIFSHLADAQTINNNDKKGSWKAPLWKALTDACLPLSWVAEHFAGSRPSLAEGFSVLSAARRFAIAVPLAETLLAGWLSAQAQS